MTKATRFVLAFSVILPALLSTNALADVTSPSIKDVGKKYTQEKPDVSHYGSGNSGRLVEASELRIAVDDLIAAGEWEKAIPKAKKAVQLDPGDPSGHLFLARALTMKFYQSKGEIDEKLLGECVREWELIRRHDADPTEQWEAGNNVKKFMKIAKALEKDKQRKEKERENEPDDSIAKDNNPGAKRIAEKASPGSDSDNSDKPKAEKKRRFGFGILQLLVWIFQQ